MLVRITGAVKNYNWGSESLIQDHFGFGAAGEKIAEVWFGTHPAGESKVASNGESLEQAASERLPFLVKFLAAASPLSIQVHPNSQQAKAGFERENALGLSLADQKRNYRDQSHKPEILIALTPFEALCGLRPAAEATQIFSEFALKYPAFEEFAKLSRVSLKETFTALLEAKELAASFATEVSESGLGEKALEAVQLAKRLLAKYPKDTGALTAMLLNHVHLEPGEAIYLPAGNLHAYLAGLGLEVMASSDNVIRAGLTEKHIDSKELMAIGDFSELLEPKVATKKLAQGLIEYPVSVPDFRVYRAQVSGGNLFADLELPSHALVIGVSGEVAVSTSLEEREVIKKSEVVYLARARKFSLSGSGEVFLVTS